MEKEKRRAKKAKQLIKQKNDNDIRRSRALAIGDFENFLNSYNSKQQQNGNQLFHLYMQIKSLIEIIKEKCNIEITEEELNKSLMAEVEKDKAQHIEEVKRSQRESLIKKCIAKKDDLFYFTHNESISDSYKLEEDCVKAFEEYLDSKESVKI